MSDLKQCPFCGGEAKLLQSTKGYKGSPKEMITNTYFVTCDNCGIHTNTYESEIWQGKDGCIHVDANGALNAIEAWNRRWADGDLD